jgi:hypothetical protein
LIYKYRDRHHRCCNSVRTKSAAAISSTAVRATSPPHAWGLDTGMLHCILASLGGSASPRLYVRKLTLMIFDSIAMIFDFVIMTFEPSIKIFDSVVMTFESTIKNL